MQIYLNPGTACLIFDHCEFQLILKPHHFAVFSVNLTAPDWEGTFAAEVIIATQFEVKPIMLTFYQSI